MAALNKLYLSSFRRLVENEQHAESFFKLFYQHLMAESPDIRYKFRHTDWARQITLLKNMLMYLQRYYETGTVNDRLQEIAHSHGAKHYAVTPKMYDQWLNAFLKSLRESDPKCTPKVEQAWVEVLTPGIEFMKSQY